MIYHITSEASCGSYVHHYVQLNNLSISSHRFKQQHDRAESDIRRGPAGSVSDVHQAERRGRQYG